MPLSEDGWWISKDGSRRRVEDLTDVHLDNILKQRRWDYQKTLVVPEGSDARAVLLTEQERRRIRRLWDKPRQYTRHGAPSGAPVGGL